MEATGLEPTLEIAECLINKEALSMLPQFCPKS